MRLETVPLNDEDLKYIYRNLPAEDIEDLWHGWQLRPWGAYGFVAMEAEDGFIIRADGVPLFVVARLDRNVWSNRAVGHEKLGIRFCRHALDYVREWANIHGTIYGHINKKYTKFIRWCEWAGLEIKDMNNGYVEVYVVKGVK